MKVLIETVPHNEQRYDTVGDWWIDVEGNWHIRVSRSSDWRYEFLVAFHELIEMALCQKAGINQDDVTAFDLNHALEDRHGEPGDSPDAPYHEQHMMATDAESVMAERLEVDWDAYVEALGEVT